MVAYQAARLVRVCRPVLAAVNVLVLGTTVLTTAVLPTGSSTNRVAGAFFLKEFVKAKICSKAGHKNKKTVFFSKSEQV